MGLAELKAELTAGHPDTGAYNANHALAADELNAINREALPDTQALLNYLLFTRFRDSQVYGRIKHVADSAVGDLLPMGVAEANVSLTRKHIHSANAFLRYVEGDTAGGLKTTDSGISNMLDDLGLGSGCHCMDGTIKSAIQAFSQNKQSRAAELGLGVVREGTVARARA